MKLEQSLISLFQVGIGIHQFNRRSEKQLGLSLVQWCLLKKLIDMPGSSAALLAEAVGIHPSTLTQTLKRLSKKGLIFATDDPSDSRKKVISITRKGFECLSVAGEKFKRWSEEFTNVNQELGRVRVSLDSALGRKKI